VWANGAGIGLQLENCDAEMKQRIVALAAPPGQAPQPLTRTPASSQPIAKLNAGSSPARVVAPARAAPTPAASTPARAAVATEAEADAALDLQIESAATDAERGAIDPAVDGDESDGDGVGDDGDRTRAANMHERLRGLTLAQQLKVAHHGEASERILLERMYSKNVWEALLRNPRLTGPEVARIARMGSLPRPQMEIILNNGGWLQIPEVRRALLTNPRLGTDQIMRILRLIPKHELKMAAMQTAYPLAVRDVAKRMLKEASG
jgi:hypothetical protein